MKPLIKSYFILLFLAVLSSSSHLAAQASMSDCSCTADLTSLHDMIKETASYKMSKSVYLKSYDEAQKLVQEANSDYECYLLLAELLLTLNDNHGRLYGADKGATEEIRGNQTQLDKFKQSELYRAYPRSSLSLDSLEAALSKSKADDIEGIYHLPDQLSLGLYHDVSKGHYIAIVLQSNNAMWNPGETIYTFIPYVDVLGSSLTPSGADGYLLGVGGSLSSKRLISYTERIDHGTFLTMGFRKDSSEKYQARSIHRDTTYLRRDISDDITYIKAGSFSSWHPTLGEADRFYASLQGNISAPHLIIDLRDNSGGGDRNSDGLRRIIKEHVKTGKVYLITNHTTVSNAEQFTLAVAEGKNCTVLGHRTNGTLTYEIKGTIGGVLSCDRYLVQLASKKHGKYLQYESRGVQPDVILDMHSEWVDQVIYYIDTHE